MRAAFDKQAQWPPRFVWHIAGLQVGYCEAFIPNWLNEKWKSNFYDGIIMCPTDYWLLGTISGHVGIALPSV